ncbi:hypothetical protein L1987_00998 [Smallanthus sonchifolius]|uniref:Uncharacterized protein n=1 Tax=Smallanthus sonchifolius TaxID=185202 RepID=A0ACB9K3W3_9ASTR|nr:hypothetical protein L1987_00998 [Smallanthus sonchifolius]
MSTKKSIIKSRGGARRTRSAHLEQNCEWNMVRKAYAPKIQEHYQQLFGSQLSDGLAEEKLELEEPGYTNTDLKHRLPQDTDIPSPLMVATQLPSYSRPEQCTSSPAAPATTLAATPAT